MQIVLTRCAGVTVLNLYRNLDSAGLAELRDCVDRIVDSGQTRIILSFHPTRHIYFKVLPELVGLSERLTNLGGWLAISGLSDYLYSIFRLQGLEDDVPIFATPEQAMSAMELEVFDYSKRAEVVALPVQPR